MPDGVAIAPLGAATMGACVTCAGAASMGACLRLMRGAAISALDCIKQVKLAFDTAAAVGAWTIMRAWRFVAFSMLLVLVVDEIRPSSKFGGSENFSILICEIFTKYLNMVAFVYN